MGLVGVRRSNEQDEVFDWTEVGAALWTVPPPPLLAGKILRI